MRQRGYSLLEVSLAVAVAMVLLAGGLYALDQHQKEARAQQSRMLLETLRTGIASFKYRTGRAPTLAEFNKGEGIGAGFAGIRIYETGQATHEPVSGTAVVAATQDRSGGWYYDPATGTLRSNISTDSVGGEDPLKW